MTRPSTVESEAAVLALTKALQVVADRRAYADTAEGGHPTARAALAERARAMTGLYLFQIEGLIRARVRAREKGIVDVPSMVHVAWLRWLQLHDRRARVVVPMDGWLVSEFPSELLSGDTELISNLANAEAIGIGNCDPFPISAPIEFVIPSRLFGDRLEIPKLPRTIGRLIGLEFSDDSGDRAQRVGQPLEPSVFSILQRLAHDLEADVMGERRASPTEYPG